MRKSKTKKIKAPKSYPNKETLWSYGMQGIEPENKEINEAFPEYHPIWIVESQARQACAENLKYLRIYILRLTQKQCAAYLRVKPTRYAAWERGTHPVPFMAYETLRLLSQSTQFKLSNEQWQGWFISREGRLVSPDRANLSFTPHELSFIREVHSANSTYVSYNNDLRAENDQLKLAIADLRAATGVDGVLDELQSIEQQLVSLSQRISSNNVVSIISKLKHNQSIAKEKVA